MGIVESFEARWGEAAPPGASAAAQELARRFYRAFVAEESDPVEVRAALVALLEHLTSVDGRTDEDHAAVDAFVCLLTAERADLHDRLPAAHREVIDAVSLDLLEGFRDPESAARFGATADALLARARALPPAATDSSIN